MNHFIQSWFKCVTIYVEKIFNHYLYKYVKELNQNQLNHPSADLLLLAMIFQSLEIEVVALSFSTPNVWLRKYQVVKS